MSIKTEFVDALSSRVLMLDGAMGTMIQRAGLSEEQFRGSRFAFHPCNLAGCNDLLALTAPDVIEAIDREYLAAGADVAEQTHILVTSRNGQPRNGMAATVEGAGV